MIQMIDRDEDGLISWHEWRDMLLLYPSVHAESLFRYESTPTGGGLMLTMVLKSSPHTRPCPVPPRSYWHKASVDGADLDLLPVHDEDLVHNWWKHLVAGGLAGAVSRTTTAPLDRLRVLLQTQRVSARASILNTLKWVLNEGGVRALWRGNGVNVMKVVPESALRFLVYDQVVEKSICSTARVKFPLRLVLEGDSHWFASMSR